MATENDFQTFAAGAGANVLSQASYLALQARITGFQTGIAQSQQLNKVWRQSSIIASMIAQFICDFSGQNAIDDGTIATLEASFNAAIQSANRIKVPIAGVNLFVSPTGNDANNGLAVGAPFATLQHAANIAASNYDTQGNNITVNMAAGTYSAGATLTGQPVGGGLISFVGNPANPAATAVTLGAPGACFSASSGARISVNGISLTANLGSNSVGQTPGVGMVSEGGALIVFANIIFQACQFAHCQGAVGGLISAAGPYTIAFGSQYHLIAGAGSQITIAGRAVTLTGTPGFSQFFAWADSAGNVFAPAPSTTFSGGATGARYLCSNGGVIATNGGGINFFPGNAVGNSTGGYYS